MQLGNANLGDEGDEGREPPALGPRMWERRWVSKMQLGKANLGDKGNEGKEPPPLGPRVGAVVGVERCTGGANLGGGGDEGKAPSPFEPRVGLQKRTRQQSVFVHIYTHY
jgi:hypothetical protein